ncbi:aspartate carbamoyltransferase catalytic subunit [Furfurilactobacillus curtus]|uniref:Aspartate carbamoyltransferase n=1 Tax=Furfurilactobacillus curtus TaxID=1746200 RepID=A0ABQ5JMF2_9LACO
MDHLTNLNDLTDEQLTRLIQLALDYQTGACPVPREPHYVANLFFENSTRTQTSFQMAELRLGWQRILVNPATSSTAKGESFSDTLKTLGAIGVEVAVIRHAQTEWYQPLLVEQSPLLPKLINAGDGSGQHPSQSLLDLMTIQQEFGHIRGLKVRIVGDLAHSRVARSNAEILQRLGASVTFSGPLAWYTSDFDQFGQFVDLDDRLADVDIVMLLRVQHERMTTLSNEHFDQADYHRQFGLTTARYDRLKDRAIIMHPAPVNRGVEMTSDLVEAPKSRIFKQMTNGVFARMAMLTMLMED